MHLKYTKEILKNTKVKSLINCEVNEIIQLVNSSSHCKCEFNQKQYEQNCFFCLMRSSCSRLCINRTKGPRSLKLNEITSQLFQYERNLDWNWKTEGHDLMMFLENTVKLLVRYEKKTLSVFGFPTGQCLKCHRSMKMEKRVIFRINSEEYNLSCLPITVEKIVKDLVERNGNGECCVDSISLESSNKFLIIKFSNPTDIHISGQDRILGKRLMYISHIKQTSKEGKQLNSAFFRQRDQILYQNSDGNICQSSFGIHKNVKMLTLLFSEGKENPESLDNFVYKSQVKKILSKKNICMYLILKKTKKEK